MAKALSTKDWSSRLMNAYMDGHITKVQLKNLLNLLPDMEKTFDGTMKSIIKMSKNLMKTVKDFQKDIPQDGSMSEAVCNQIMVEMVKTGFALIRKVSGLVEGAV